jgi:hypothetical protein
MRIIIGIAHSLLFIHSLGLVLPLTV